MLVLVPGSQTSLYAGKPMPQFLLPEQFRHAPLSCVDVLEKKSIVTEDISVSGIKMKHLMASRSLQVRILRGLPVNGQGSSDLNRSVESLAVLPVFILWVTSGEC